MGARIALILLIELRKRGDNGLATSNPSLNPLLEAEELNSIMEMAVLSAN